jgi:hypothetical protein
VVDAIAKTSYLARLRAAKTLVAQALGNLVIPVFDKLPPLPKQAGPAAQEAMRQTMLERLTNAFAADVVVQFPLAVQASIDEPAPPRATAVAPRLYGSIAFDQTDAEATLTATGAKIDLVAAAPTAPEILTFVVTTSFPAGETPPAYVPVAAGASHYDASNIEHQIGSLTGIVGYEASSWLSFPVGLQADPKNALATAEFPAYAVPVIERAYPANPHLDKQLGEHEQGSQPDLRKAREWNYEALFSRDSHPPQDRLQVSISFQPPAQKSALRARRLGEAPPPPPPPDSFSALAEFAAAYPKIAAALDAKLRPIDPGASKEAIAQASLALGSFVALVEYVAQGLANEFGGKPTKGFGVAAADAYAFELFEGDVTVDAYVLVVDAPPPTGIGTPSVAVARLRHAGLHRQARLDAAALPGADRGRHGLCLRVQGHGQRPGRAAAHARGRPPGARPQHRAARPGRARPAGCAHGHLGVAQPLSRGRPEDRRRLRLRHAARVVHGAAAAQRLRRAIASDRRAGRRRQT